MMSKLDRLAQAFSAHVKIGWPASSSGAQRVIMLVYDPSDERALRRKLDLFAQGAHAAGKSWDLMDLAPIVAEWLAGHRYKEVYFAEPDELSTAAEDRIAAAIAQKVEAALVSDPLGPDGILALYGVAALFGFTSLSDILARVEHAIPGRLLVFFPGRVQDGRYRLLDARESWDYHAVPITLDDHGEF
jgi:hypothetical protein